ncbi:hypothetical protein TNCT_226891 [Trichonephila clavata]|uniref:Uncharacterized protein n=1 Tax=Trichonephila clavata TaxID=2740835 RepID=A0A8X6LSJ0_TRICU|nr:hypothetical protein TNCT_226891 [Trichonephila clavata]
MGNCLWPNQWIVWMTSDLDNSFLQVLDSNWHFLRDVVIQDPQLVILRVDLQETSPRRRMENLTFQTFAFSEGLHPYVRFMGRCSTLRGAVSFPL